MSVPVYDNGVSPWSAWITGLFRFAIIVCAALAVWTCNVSETSVEKVVNIGLDDSLTVDAGLYDSLRVDIHLADGTVFKENAFHGPYYRTHGGKLRINLGVNAPDRYDIILIAYQDGVAVRSFKISMSKNAVIGTVPIGTTGNPGNPGNPETLSQVTIFPTSLTLEAGGPGERLTARVTPESLVQGVAWSSTNPGIASVDGNGLVTPLKEGETEIIARALADTSRTARIPVVVGNAGVRKVDSIRMSPRQVTLYVGGSSGQVQGKVHPVDPPLGVVFMSTEDALVRVSQDGRLTAVAAGEALVLVRPQGRAGPEDTCRVTVVVDPPVLEVGGDRQAKVGEELVFPIRVTQKHGGVAMLKWDLDGDGNWDPDSARDSVASPRRAYPEGGKEIRIGFYARDTEGNEATARRRVVVGSNAPFVTITRPASMDTLVNTPKFTVEFEVDGVKKSQEVDLSEGPNPVPITVTTAGGTGRDSVNIVLDTRPPVVKITAPAPKTLTNKAAIGVAWTVDGMAQPSGLSETLSGKQGTVRIVRESVDPAGNRGADTVLIVRDTVPPPPPVFTAGTTPTPTNNPRPSWRWSGSPEGNGAFRIVFQGDAGKETRDTLFTPDANLPDGSYTLSIHALDSAGNLSTAAARTLEVRTQGPGAPVVSAPAGPTNAPAWTWTGSGRNGARFRAILFKAGQAARVDSVETTTLAYTPSAALLAGSNGTAFTLRVREQDALGNWGNEGSATTRVDVVAPAAPTLSAPAYSSASPAWTWTAVETGARYEYRLLRQGVSAPVAQGTTQAPAYPPQGIPIPGLTTGTYRLHVRTLDSAGNGSAEVERVVRVDLDDPTVAVTGPSEPGRITSGNPVITGTAADNLGLRTLAWSAPGATPASGNLTLSGGSWSLTGVNYRSGATTVTVTATDSAGRTASVEVGITKLPNVVFVRKNATGKGDGRSWADAYTELWQVLESAAIWPAGTQVWVSKGSYATPPNTFEFMLRPSMEVYGGFSDAGNATSISQRDIALHETQLMSGVRFSPQATSSSDIFVLDGFFFRQGSRVIHVGVPGTVEIRNCRLFNFIGAGLEVQAGAVKLIDSYVGSGTQLEYAAIVVYRGARLEITRSQITNNTSDRWTGGGLNVYGGVAIVRNSRFTGNQSIEYDPETNNPNLVSRQISLMVDGNLTIGGTTIQGGVARIYGQDVGTVIDEGGNQAQ